jgi:hypothetical protein
MNLNEYSQHSKTKIIVYGAPKSGKTALVGKLAATHTLHYLDLENGIKTLLNPAMLDPKYRANINVISIPDHRLNPIAIDTVRDILRGGSKKICRTHGKVNCPLCAKNPEAVTSTINLSEFTSKDILVIDSLSQLSNSAASRATFKEINKPDGDDYKPTYADYMRVGALMDQVLSLIQVLDLNIIAISHETDNGKEDAKEKLVPLAGTRNFSSTVGKYFDAIVYCTVLNKQHRAYSSSTHSSGVVTGSRVNVVLDELKGADLSLAGFFKSS